MWFEYEYGFEQKETWLMKIISFKDIADLNVQPLMCFDWAEAMIRSKKEALLPPKISLKPYDGEIGRAHV